MPDGEICKGVCYWAVCVGIECRHSGWNGALV